MHFFGVNFFAIDTALRPSKVTLNITYTPYTLTT